jgi:hypothetical protein
MIQLSELNKNILLNGKILPLNKLAVGGLSAQYLSSLFSEKSLPENSLTLSDIKPASIIPTDTSLTFSGTLVMDGKSVAASVFLFDIQVNNSNQRHCLLLLESESLDLTGLLSRYDTSTTNANAALSGSNSVLSLKLKNNKILFSSLANIQGYKSQLPDFVTKFPISLDQIQIGLQFQVDLTLGNSLLAPLKLLSSSLTSMTGNLNAFVKVEFQLALEISIPLKGISTPIYDSFPALSLNQLDLQWSLNYLSQDLPSIAFLGEMEIGGESINVNSTLDISAEQLFLDVIKLPEFSQFASLIGVDGSLLSGMATSWPSTFSSVISDLNCFDLQDLYINIDIKNKTWTRSGFTLTTDSPLELLGNVVSIKPSLNIIATHNPSLNPKTTLEFTLTGDWDITPKSGNGTVLSTYLSIPNLDYSIEIPVGEGFNLSCLVDIFGSNNTQFITDLYDIQILDFEVEGNFKEKSLSAQIDTISDFDFTIEGIDFKVQGLDMHFDYANGRVQDVTLTGCSQLGPVYIDLNGEYDNESGWTISGGTHISNDIGVSDWFTGLVGTGSDLVDLISSLPGDFATVSLANLYFLYIEEDGSVVINTGLKKSIPIINNFSIDSFYAHLNLNKGNKILEVKALIEIANVDIELDVEYEDSNSEAGWTFSGSTVPGQDIEIENLFSFIKNKLGFSASVPTFIKDVVIADIGVQIDTVKSSESLSLKLGFTDSNQSNNWLSFHSLSLDLSTTNKTMNLQCAATVLGLNIDLSAAQNSIGQWGFNGVTKKGQTIVLTNIVNQLVNHFGLQLPSGIPQVSLENLSLSFNSNDSFSLYGKSVTQATLPLGDGSHKIDLSANINIAKDKHTGKSSFIGSMFGQLVVDGNTFDIRFQLGSLQQVIEGSWSAGKGSDLAVSDALKLFGLPVEQGLPSEHSFDFVDIAFEYQLNSKKVIISGSTVNGCEAFIWASKGQQHSWEVVVGLVVEQSAFKLLSDIPVIGSGLKSATLLVANTSITNFSLPELPMRSATTTKASAFSMDGSPVSIEEGSTFIAAWDLCSQSNKHSTDSNSKKINNVQSLVGKDELSVLISGCNIKEKITLTVELDGGFSIPTGKSSNLKLENTSLKIVINSGDLYVELLGSMVVHIDGEFINATAHLVIKEHEADVSIVVSGKSPKGMIAPSLLKGVHIDSFGIEMGVYFEPPGFEMGLTGKLHIGQQPQDSDGFAFFLEIIEEVPNPLLLAFNANNISIGEGITAVTGQPPIAAILNDIKFQDVAFYWCDDVVVLPDGTTAMPGFRFHGSLDLFGFGTYGQFQTNSTSMNGKAELNPIELALNGVQLFSLDGDGKGIKIKEEESNGTWVAINNTKVGGSNNLTLPTRTIYAVNPGGAVFDFNTATLGSFINGSAHVKLLGLYSESLDLTISDSGITFHYQESAAKITNIKLDVILTTMPVKSKLNADGLFYFHLKGCIGPIIPGLSFTKISLDVGLDGKLSVAINESSFNIAVSGDFEFEGVSLTLPEFTIDEPFSDIDELAEKIWKQIEDQSETIFKDIINGAKALLGIAKGEVLMIANDAEQDVKAISQDAVKASKAITKAAVDVAHAVEATEQSVHLAATKIAGEALNIASTATADVKKIGDTATADASAVKKEGKALIKAAGIAVERITSEATQAVTIFGTEIENTVGAAEQKVKNIGKDAIHDAEEFIGGANKYAGEALNAAKEAVDAIDREATKAWNDVKNLAAAAAHALAQTASHAWHSVKSWF